MTARKPNFLFLFSDEHDPRHMGVSGSPLVKTPHLDALAQRGTRFVNASTPCSICVPARGSLATGLHVHEAKYWDNAIAYEGKIQGWCHALAQAGHRIESIGKLHYTRTEDPTGFDAEHLPMHIFEGIGMVWGSIRDPLPKGRHMRQMLKEIGPGMSNYNQFDLDVTSESESWIHARAASPDDKPWALFVGMVAPHFPLVAPQEYFDLYPTEAIAKSKLLPSDGHEWHPWIADREAYMGQDHHFDGEPERRKLAIAGYYALCSFMDYNMGRVLKALEDSGQLDNTIVVYTSDHGDNIGQRALWGKSNLYKESTDVPMIVAGPGIAHDEVNTTPVGLTDIHATALDILGVPDIDDEYERPSQSLLQILGNNAERTMLSQYHAAGAPTGAFMMNDGRYKYHYYVDYPSELFDFQSDPEELNNIADDPAFAPIQERLHAALIDQLGGRTPETVDRMAKDDQNELIERFGGPEKAKSVGTPGATPVPGKGHE